MNYTLAEAVARKDLTLLDRLQFERLLKLADLGEHLEQVLAASDVPCGFIGADDAHAPAQMVEEYKDLLISGSKEERTRVYDILKSDLDSHAETILSSAQYGLSCWNQILKDFGGDK